MSFIRIPNRVGIGIVLGFFIPVLWVVVSSRPANSIDTSVALAGDGLPQAESDLIQEEQKILRKLGWKPLKKEPTPRERAAFLLDDDSLNSPPRAAYGDQADDKTLRVEREQTRQDLQEIDQMTRENDALLAALVAEYEELEKTAESLSDIDTRAMADQPKELSSNPSVQKRPAAAKKKPELRDQMKREGLQVVGEGKEWVERRSAAAKGDGNRYSKNTGFNPYFGRIEFVQ